MILEFIIYAMQPYLIGMAVDALLDDRPAEFYGFIAFSSIACIIGLMRRMVDTRTFSYIWERRAVASINGMIRSGVTPSSIISRGHLQTTYGDFLEYTMPTIVSATIDVITSVIMLWIVIPHITAVAIPCLAMLLFIQIKASQTFMHLDRQRQHASEACDRSIVNCDTDSVERSYAIVPIIMIRRSDLEAAIWTVSDILSITISAFMIIALTTEKHSVGDIISSVTYCRQMFFKANFINFLLSHLRQMKLSEELSSCQSKLS